MKEEANGNSPAANDYQPIEFLAVGGYDDGGLSDLSLRKEHPLASWGINGDGDMRPDILAPFTYLPAPYYEAKKSYLYSPYFDPTKSNIKVSYFAGTSGASTLIAGVCAYLLSAFPELKNEMLKKMLTSYGVSIINAKNLAPSVHVGQIVDALSNGTANHQSISNLEFRDSKNHEINISSLEEIQRGKALTKLVDQGQYTREMLWETAEQGPARMEKVAIWALAKAMGISEKMRAWECFYKSDKDGTGVRESWAYMLLNGSEKEDLEQWMSLIIDESTDVRLCVKIFLERFYPDAPELEHTPDPNPDIIPDIINPVLGWYEGYKNKNNGAF